MRAARALRRSVLPVTAIPKARGLPLLGAALNFGPSWALAAREHRYAWLPFGGGPRVCLGSRFAMMEMQLTIARILQRYSVRWAGRGPVRPRVIFNSLLPREVPLELIPRA
jgi:cytochrome P450